MSTSLLYHAFGVKGYRYVRTEYRDGQVRFTLEPSSRLAVLQWKHEPSSSATGG